MTETNSLKSFKSNPLGQGTNDLTRVGVWEQRMRGYIKGKELDIEDTSTPVEARLCQAKEAEKKARADLERRTVIDLQKAVTIPPQPPLSPNQLADDRRLGTKAELERELERRENKTILVQKEKAKMFAAVEGVLEMIESTLDAKNYERINAAMDSHELKDNRVGQVNHALVELVRQLGVDKHKIAAQFRKDILEIGDATPESSNQLLELLHKLDTIKANSDANAKTYKHASLVKTEDMLESLKDAAASMNIDQIGAEAEALIRTANADSVIWKDFSEAVCRALKSKDLSNKNGKKRKSEEQETMKELKAFKAASQEQFKKISEKLEEYKSKHDNKTAFYAGGDDWNVCREWKANGFCRWGDACKYRSSHKPVKGSGSSSPARSPQQTSKPGTPRQVPGSGKSSRSASTASSRDASPAKEKRA